jgi:hypothetical protein
LSLGGSTLVPCGTATFLPFGASFTSSVIRGDGNVGRRT